MNIDYASIGRQIKYYRKLNNLTQENLSDITGISYVHISNIEKGKKHPSLEALIKIANALEVSADALLIDNSIETRDTELTLLLKNCSPEETQFLIRFLQEIWIILRDRSTK